jgi:putative ABC transport system permease protein
MGSFRQDLRWALLSMRRNPGLTVIVILSLALAIGVNTAVFSVVDSFLLRPLAIRDLDRMVRVREVFGKPGGESDVRSMSIDTYLQWQDSNRVFSGIGAGLDINMTLTGGDRPPERLTAIQMTQNLFPVLGVRPILGRNLLAEEDRPGGPRVVLVSHRLWTSHYGADPRILGRTLLLDGLPYTVVGVMARGFRHPYDADVWVPARFVRNSPSLWNLYTPARLKPGVTLEQAQSEMVTLVRTLARERPLPDAPSSVQLRSLRGDLVQGLDKKLLLLSIAAGFVLLIACANVTNLLLAKSLGQETEVAVRVALGATRRRLVRQFLTYSILLALLGGALGLLLSFSAIRPLVALSPAVESLAEFDTEPRLDLSTLGFTFLISALVGAAFGLAPALRVSRSNLNSSLKEGGRSRTMGSAGLKLLNSFVVSEVALAVILLVGAGLMLQSFQKIRHKDRGFAPANLLTFEVAFPSSRYPEERQKVRFIREAVLRMRHLPGVTAAGATTTQPMFQGQNYISFNAEGHPADPARGFNLAHYRTVTPAYLAALKVPVLSGRGLTDRDNETAPGVVLVSRSLAQQYWPGQSPLGKRLKRGRYDSTRPWLTVVGVVGNLSETANPDNPGVTTETMYLPYPQTNLPDIDSIIFVLRSGSDPNLLISPAREVIDSLDRSQPIYDVATMDQRIAERTKQDRLTALLYGIFGVMGLVLSVVGLYGVLSFAVSQRLREMGIRSAMGAQPQQLKLLIFRRALILTALGLALGTLGALFLSRYLETQLNDTNPGDPLAFLGALAVLAVITLVSSSIPANRAAKVDPVRALRYE